MGRPSTLLRFCSAARSLGSILSVKGTRAIFVSYVRFLMMSIGAFDIISQAIVILTIILILLRYCGGRAGSRTRICSFGRCRVGPLHYPPLYRPYLELAPGIQPGSLP